MWRMMIPSRSVIEMELINVLKGISRYIHLLLTPLHIHLLTH